MTDTTLKFKTVGRRCVQFIQSFTRAVAAWSIAAGVTFCCPNVEAQAPSWHLPIGARVHGTTTPERQNVRRRETAFEDVSNQPPEVVSSGQIETGQIENSPLTQHKTHFEATLFQQALQSELASLYSPPAPGLIDPSLRHGLQEGPAQFEISLHGPKPRAIGDIESTIPASQAIEVAAPMPLAQPTPAGRGQSASHRDELIDGSATPSDETSISATQTPVTEFHSGIDGDLRPCRSACPSPYIYDDFSPTPLAACSVDHNAMAEMAVYDAKHAVATQQPWVEWGRIFYGDGITPRGRNWFGDKNLARPEFYLYGDFRSGIATGRNAVGRTDNWANRLNLDMDLQLTDSERFHAFVGPLDRGVNTTRWERTRGEYRFRNELDLTPVTGYFEGDLGVMLGAAHGQSPPFEFPIAIGLVPLLFQNGIWMEDAVTGAAVSFPANHSRLLNWSNFDATFFAVLDQLDSVAFGNNEHAAQAFGTAWFIEAYDGYIESGYAFVRDRNNEQRSYHNVTASFTRRYFDRISNSVRVIVNAGQDLPSRARTADGVLLLVENSLITASPLRVVPYANFFVGWNRPQSVARAGVSGGILRNTGINFDTDGLNGFATLDPTASDTAGGSIGLDLIGNALDRQLILEAAWLTPHGSANPHVAGDQYAVGTRYQLPLNHCTLLRLDAMYGWREGLVDVYGTRMEYRWKF